MARKDLPQHTTWYKISSIDWPFPRTKFCNFTKSFLQLIVVSALIMTWVLELSQADPRSLLENLPQYLFWHTAVLFSGVRQAFDLRTH